MNDPRPTDDVGTDLDTGTGVESGSDTGSETGSGLDTGRWREPADEPAPGATVRWDADRAVATFVVWAPDASSVRLHPSSPGSDVALEPIGGGYWRTELDDVGHGWRYRYSLDGGEPLPDPASGWQPDGVHGASAVVDTTRFDGGFEWTDGAWRGIDLADTVLYELHVGTFTPAGTFDAAIAELPRLAALGVTTVELMPVNAFPGERNWGYDGVFAYAVQESYGGPAGLARFVDAAHAAGLAVVLDVVYNHLGPEGNVLARYGPYFTDAYDTPWGDAVNVARSGSDGVRRYICHNVERWVVDFHVDGFRLDAVHAVIDPTANPLWEQVAETARAAGRAARRRVVTIAESSDNDPRYVRTPDRGGYGLDAVWNDDVHHSLRVALTGERRTWYADYVGDASELADVVEHRWKWRGQHSPFRGRRHGRPVDDVPPHRFVTYSTNHDQIGNRPAGDRPALDAPRRRFAPAAVLLMPSTPMLFMGEEYGETAPFPFFVDHGDPEILEATRRGRRAEFADADWDVEVPDPGDPATMRAAVLDPGLAEREPHRSLLAMYTELLRLRRDVETVSSPVARQRVTRHGDVVGVHRHLAGATGADGSASTLLLNVGDTVGTAPLGREHEGRAPSLAFDSADPRWRGEGTSTSAVHADDATVTVTVTVAPWSVALVTS